MKLFTNIVETVGRTPLIKLARLSAETRAEVFIKLESHNPMNSVKDRIGVAMIDAAEKAGLIKANTVIVEPTSGNTGIALAFVAAARKYKLVLTMPESMSLERRAMLRALGADLVLTPAEQGMRGAINKAMELVENTPGAWIPQQFENPANPAIHETTTGPEIWEDSGRSVDVIVSGVGTGGTITGVTRFIRKQNPRFQAFAVEPADSPVISGGKPGPHKIQGIGAGFVPKNLDTSLLSGVITVTNDEAFEWGRRLAREEGIFAGISTGANVCAVTKAIRQHSLAGKRVVTIACSFGERYLSTALYKDLAGGVTGMKVTVEYTGVLDIKAIPSGGAVELPAGSTVSALLERLGIQTGHRKFITPLVNNAKARNSAVLSEGDRVYLLLPVGGGE